MISRAGMTRYSLYSMAVVATLSLSGCLPSESTMPKAGLVGATPTPPPKHGDGEPGGQPVVSKAQTTNITMVLGDRDFLRSTLEYVFLSETSSTAVQTGFKTIFNNTITANSQAFGGNMNLYSTLGLKELPSAFKSGMNGRMNIEDWQELGIHAASTPGRVSVLKDFCRQLMNVNDSYLNEALLKIGVTAPTTTPVSSAGIESLYELFRPGTDVGPEVITSTNAVISAMKTNTPTLSNLEQWRAVVYLTCANPHWQSL